MKCARPLLLLQLPPRGSPSLSLPLSWFPRQRRLLQEFFPFSYSTSLIEFVYKTFFIDIVSAASISDALEKSPSSAVASDAVLLEDFIKSLVMRQNIIYSIFCRNHVFLHTYTPLGCLLI